jgi:3-deoxy-manno-octulosonate cytidylyltransferase (CMP-KDO synthetase)
VIIVPARRASSRFPDKLLAEVKGKPLIRWTVDQAKRTGFQVLVATDSREIAEVCGANGVLTGDCLNGTERCIEAANMRLGVMDRRMIINWQGDSPLTRPEWVKMLAERMDDSPCAVGTLQQFVDREAMEGEVHVEHGYDETIAASFSRVPRGHRLAYRHVGIYAIKPEAFQIYGRCPSRRELQMNLEQLRWADRGVAIAAFTVADEQAIEVNYPADLELLGSLLEANDAIG